MSQTLLLNEHNYKSGFLVDEELIGGVTEMAENVYAAYVSHYLTGETLAYQEFDELTAALQYLSTLPRSWSFEAVGCSTHTKKTAGGCGTSTSGGSGCNSCSCS